MTNSAADPDSHSGECVDAQLRNDRLEPVMAAGTSPGAEPDRAERQIDVVNNNEHVGERSLIPIDGFPHRGPAQVHVCLRLEEYDLLSLVECFDKVGAKSITSFAHNMPPRELIDDHETEVAPGRGVLPARVPQTHDDLHNQDASHADAALFQCYTPAAILPRRLISHSLTISFSQRGHTAHVWHRLPGNVHRPGRGSGHLRSEPPARTCRPSRQMGSRLPAHELRSHG